MTYEENVRAILESNFAGFKEEVIDTACKMILGLRTYGEWIPCSERLPEPDKFVLICGEEGDIEVAKGYVSTEIEEFVWLKSSWRFGEVVAWMPLPEPYKEGDLE